MSKNISIYISYILRHHPEEIGLDMDKHGWVNTKDLIKGINDSGKYQLEQESLEQIVVLDEKGRYKFNEDKTRIKACQGHSIPWVEPELTYKKPPQYLYHGTTTEALDKIFKTGHIDKMNRHAVHMQADESLAWKSAVRWKGKKPIVIKIAAREMYDDGKQFGVSDNDVWCTEEIPTDYIHSILREIKLK